MTIAPATRDGLRLLHDGVRALAVVERNGLKLDLKHFDGQRRAVSLEIQDLENELRADKEVWGPWRRRYGADANLDSLDQLGHVVFNVLGMDYPADGGFTKTGKRRMDESVLERVPLDFCKKVLRRKKLLKVLSTNINGITREAVGDVLHPTYNLHITDSFRSSSSEPNSQNLPSRNKEMARIVKSGFIPHHPDWHFVEVDYVGIEVHTMYCYHRDPVMYKYLTDPTTDMHRDTAAAIYCLDPSEVSKDARYAAKNKFVFPQFYGSYYPDCARALWDYMVRSDIRVESKSPGGGGAEKVIDRLKARGILERGACDGGDKPRPKTFEKHVMEVEADFWGRRFRHYNAWKKDWYNRYLSKGYFDSFTGFRHSGIFRRNQVLNLMNQGDAFHCLLLSLILTQQEIHRRKWRTKIVGQIHDSKLSNVPPDEIQDYLTEVERIMTVEVPRRWKWITIPIKIEVEVSPPGKSWFHKEKWVKDARGVWGPAKK